MCRRWVVNPRFPQTEYLKLLGLGEAADALTVVREGEHFVKADEPALGLAAARQEKSFQSLCYSKGNILCMATSWDFDVNKFRCIMIES